mmetsp:Transcript_48388/g.127754  ORF Transcript_48388/g.127754 Transcript_48388/m.127754 type:complete len:269 (+) Transcript_48388:24-830(+)
MKVSTRPLGRTRRWPASSLVAVQGAEGNGSTANEKAGSNDLTNARIVLDISLSHLSRCSSALLPRAARSKRRHCSPRAEDNKNTRRPSFSHASWDGPTTLVNAANGLQAKERTVPLSRPTTCNPDLSNKTVQSSAPFGKSRPSSKESRSSPVQMGMPPVGSAPMTCATRGGPQELADPAEEELGYNGRLLTRRGCCGNCRRCWESTRGNRTFKFWSSCAQSNKSTQLPHPKGASPISLCECSGTTAADSDEAPPLPVPPSTKTASPPM